MAEIFETARRLVLYDGVAEENDTEFFRHRMQLFGSFTANQNGSIRAGPLFETLQGAYFDLLEAAFPYQDSGRPQQPLTAEQSREALMQKVAELQKHFSADKLAKPLFPPGFKPGTPVNVRQR